MNIRVVIKQLGLLLIVLSFILIAIDIVTWLVQFFSGDSEGHAKWAMAISAGVGFLIGGIMYLACRNSKSNFGRREALLLVALSWLVGAALAALPYYFWAHLPGPGGTMLDHPFRGWINCYFEAMSGLTTTGATILGAAPNDIESIPKGLLLWRALTHWLGGLGIIVLFVAVLPSLGVGGKKLFRVEAPGPEPEGVRPVIRDTARILWFIYLGLTIMEIVALWLAGMNWFDAACHTFATLATGGFSTVNASIGQYNSTAYSVIITIFMVLAGANFSLYFLLIRRKFAAVFADTELRVYLSLLAIGSAIVVISLMMAGDPIVMTTGDEIEPNLANSLREGVFTTVAIQTTTGFCSSDFNKWPFIAQATLIFLMFVGGCAGSTGGGFKVIRLWITLKVLLAEIERVFRPNVVRPLKIGSSTIDDDLKLSTVAYLLGIVLLFGLGAIGVMGLEQIFNPPGPGEIGCNFTTAATASIATLNTIGPGLARVGAIENYGWLSAPSKSLLCIWMALGRLEVFAIIVLFTPRFWRGN